MKKTLNVNLNGRVFTIDEDAYRLLEDYLSNLRIYFRKEEGGAEIIADFEARIEELFNEKVRLGYQVITIEHVEEVIARVGKPADFAENEEKEEEKQVHQEEPVKGKKKFFRNMEDKLLGGVCSGIAAYFGWSVVAVRLVLIVSPFVLSSFKFYKFFPSFFITDFFGNFWLWLLFAYVIAWIIVPVARSAEQKLQMQGKPITVENIGKTVSAQSAPVAYQQPKGCLSNIVDVFVAFLKVCLAGLGCLIGLPLLFALIVIIFVFFVVIAAMLGVGGGLVGAGSGLLGAIPPFFVLAHPVLATITGCLLIGIPVITVIYAIISSIAKLKPMNQWIKWSILVTWIVSLVLFFSIGFRIKSNTRNTHNWKWFSFVEKNKNQEKSIPSQVVFDFNEPITGLEANKYLNANLYIVQTQDETSSIEIDGDKNLVEEVRHDLKNGRLVLSCDRKQNNNNLKITLRTSDLQSIKVGFVGNIYIDRAFTGDALEVSLRGVGSFNADSLYVNSLNVRSDGVGAITLSGKAGNVRLENSGVGKIDAMKLLADTIYARMEGVGSIQCNPVEYLEAHTQGIGSITYKDEPVNKKVSSSGIGKVKKR